MGRSSLLRGSWRHSDGSASRTGGRPITTRKATATSNGSNYRKKPRGSRANRQYDEQAQFEKRGSLEGRVPQLGRSTEQHRPLDRRVQSRPASSRNRKSYSARGLLGFHSCSKFGDPDCLVLSRALQSRSSMSLERSCGASGSPLSERQLRPKPPVTMLIVIVRGAD